MFQSLIGRLRTLSRSRSPIPTVCEFQSLIGRLRTSDVLCIHLLGTTFQSLIGRLRTRYGALRGGDKRTSFNPLQVGYEPSKGFTSVELCQYSFNPLQVGYELKLNSTREVSLFVSIPYRQATNSIEPGIIMDEPTFQSLIGRLRTKLARECISASFRFQSLIGRLRTLSLRQLPYLLPLFQSLIGRLRTQMNVLLPILLLVGFNPLQVGYELKGFVSVIMSCMVSIPYRQATNCQAADWQTGHLTGFQSLIGRLRTENLIDISLYWLRFQSLIGRLRTKEIYDILSDLFPFQSLIGRLRTTQVQ